MVEISTTTNKRKTVQQGLLKEIYVELSTRVVNKYVFSNKSFEEISL